MALRPHQRLRQRAFLAYSRLSRGMTLGVRAILLKDRHVALVKHTYLSGWYLPGGGVEAGESFSEALVREISEEAGAILTGPADLFAVYRNAHVDPRDHVALFVCRSWEQTGTLRLPNREILASELFPLEALPDGTTQATRARLREVMEDVAPSPDW
jgi:ADP-ribose pyrophosphatase YjhB (NUDIX family)